MVEFFAAVGIFLMFVITIVIVFVVNIDLRNRTIDLEERVSDLEKKQAGWSWSSKESQ